MDFETVAQAALARAGVLLAELLPGGRIIGSEYCCSSIFGGYGDSFRVNMNTGAWCEFNGTGDLKGGDLVSLFAAVHGLKNGEACKRLGDQIGINQPKKQTDPRIGRPPKGVGVPEMGHRSWGEPVAHWVYQDRDGIIFYVARYNTSEGKQFLPWSWAHAFGKWICKGYPEPRPLYGLLNLESNLKAPVLIVEGEKTCDAAQVLVGTRYACVSWPNGAKGIRKVDFTPIWGKKLLLWPDADDPGVKAMNEIARILSPRCQEIKILNIEGQPESWDAYDAVAQIWKWEQFYEWAKPRAKGYGLTPLSATPKPVAAPKNEIKPQPVQIIEPKPVKIEEVKQTEAEVVKRPETKVNVTVEQEDRPTDSNVALWEALGLACVKNGAPYNNANNVVRAFMRDPVLQNLIWFDEFHKKFYTTWNCDRPREWEDVDDINLTIYFQDKLAMQKMSPAVIKEGCMSFAKMNTRNEPKEWMESLKWDGTPRIEDFIPDGLGGEYGSNYIMSASKNFWISMAARVYRPGCQVDNMLVLEGAQGIGKTNALRVIGGEWYAEAQENIMSKDFFMILRGKIIIEVSELNAFKRAEVTRIKQVITAATDRYRAPYERHAKDHPRQSVFVGTTNQQTYLDDETGGRRFWPIVCGEINLKWIKENREQLFAEAVKCFKSGEMWYEMPLGETTFEQEKRRTNDAWEGSIFHYLKIKDETSIKDIAIDCLGIDLGKIGKFETQRIIAVLRKFKWRRRWSDGEGNKWEKVISDPLPEV